MLSVRAWHNLPDGVLAAMRRRELWLWLGCLWGGCRRSCLLRQEGCRCLTGCQVRLGLPLISSPWARCWLRWGGRQVLGRHWRLGQRLSGGAGALRWRLSRWGWRCHGGGLPLARQDLHASCQLLCMAQGLLHCLLAALRIPLLPPLAVPLAMPLEPPLKVAPGMPLGKALCMTLLPGCRQAAWLTLLRWRWGVGARVLGLGRGLRVGWRRGAGGQGRGG